MFIQNESSIHFNLLYVKALQTSQRNTAKSNDALIPELISKSSQLPLFTTESSEMH